VRAEQTLVQSTLACAVRQQQNQALPPSRPCSEPNVWLVTAPPGAQQPVLDVVAPAALSAMDVGRRPMWFRHFHATTPPLLDIQQCVQAGCTRAISAFWLAFTTSPRCSTTSLIRVGREWERPTPSCTSQGSRRVSVSDCHYDGVLGRGNGQQRPRGGCQLAGDCSR
jgi:hypothetical protein